MSKFSGNNIDLLILKYLQNEGSKDEHVALETWMQESEPNKKYFEDCKAAWEEAESLHDFERIDVDQQWELFKDRVKGTEETKTKSGNFLKIAASIALLLGIGYLLNSIVFNEVTLVAETGKENKFILPDNSIVWLRANSQLTYKKHFKGDKRTVDLQGEGYFEIQKNKEKPFIVKTNGTTTQVLGTSFTIGTDPKTQTTTLVLVEGAVSFTFQNQTKTLEPGETVVATKDGILIKNKNSNPNFNSWKTGIFRFNDQSLTAVLTTLEKHYGKKIILENEKLISCRVTLTFDNESLEEILEVFKLVLHISYIQNGKKEILIQGGDC